jgi:transposase-like protein
MNVSLSSLCIDVSLKQWTRDDRGLSNEQTDLPQLCPNIAKGAVYPTEFREEAVHYWLSSGQTLAAVSADLGLTPDCLRSWRRQMEAASTQQQTSEADAAKPTATTKELALARENGELRRELEALTSAQRAASVTF